MTRSTKPSELFPARLREAREIRKLSQAELAKKARLPPSSISHFEAGSRKPSFDNLRRLAAALTVSTDFLLGRTDELEGRTDADPLYRHVKNLSDDDREVAELFLESLAKRHRKRGDDEQED